MAVAPAWKRRLFLIVFAIALTVRIAYIVDLRNSPYYEHPILDAYWYDSRAQEVLAGDSLASQGAFRVPLYIYFLTGCYSLFGHEYGGVLSIQAILGSLACGIVLLLGLRIFGLAGGLIAGLGLALYRMAIFSDGELLPTTLFIVLVLLGAYYVVELLRTDRYSKALVGGLWLGLAFLTRPDVLPFVVAVVVLIFITFSLKKAFGATVLVIIPIVVAMLLLGFRNRTISGEFYVFSPQGAVNLYAGNSLASDGKTPQAPATRTPYTITADPGQDAMLLASKVAASEDMGRELSDRELGRYYLERTLREIQSKPVRWIGLLLRKVYYFLNSYERSDIKPLWRFGRRHSKVFAMPLLSYAILMPLGLLGAGLVVARRIKLAYIALAGLLAFGFNSVVFFVSWRNRLPAVAFLWILAGYAVTHVVSQVHAGRWSRVLSCGVIIFLLALVSKSHFFGVTDEPFATQYMVNEAAVYAMSGKYDEAIAIYEEAIGADPANPSPYYLLGKVYAKLGKIDECRKMMAAATRLNRAYLPYAHLTIGVALTKNGDLGGAAEEFTQALAADPNLGLAAYNLGLCLLNAGRFEEARTALMRAETLCADDAQTMSAIAIAWIKLGEAERAEGIVRKILRSHPKDVDVLYALGLALEAQGKNDEALGYFKMALRYRPDREAIRTKVRQLESLNSLR